MKIRVHRGGLKESMETTEEIEPTEEAVRKYLGRHSPSIFPPSYKVIALKHQTLDNRTGWDTYMVLGDGCPIAYTDGPLT